MPVKLPTLDTEALPTPRPASGIVSYRGESGAELLPAQAGFRTAAALDSVSDETFIAHKREQEKIDTMRAEDAFTKLRERQLDLTAGPENGYLNQKGAAAVTRPLAKEWGAKFDGAYKEIAAGLQTPEQKAKFAQRANISRLQFDEGMLGHLARQNVEYTKETDDGITKIETRAAAANWQNPDAVALSLERIRASTDTRAKAEGWAKEYQEAMYQERAGKVHSAVIGQAVASGQLKFAEEYFIKNRADIDPTTAKALEKAVEDGAQKQLSNGYRAEFLATQGNNRSLTKLLDKVIADPNLDDGRRNALVGPIQNKISANELRAERERDRAERRGLAFIKDYNDNTLAGYVSQDPTAGLNMVNAFKGTALEGEAQRAFALAEATRTFSFLPPSRQEAEISKAEALVRQDPSKFDRKIIGAWKDIAAKQKEDVQKDPVTFAVRQGIAPPTTLDLSQPAALAPALEQRFSIAAQMEAKNNAPYKPLTVEETALLKATLDAKSPQEKVAYFGMLKNQSVGNMRGYAGLVAQLAPDSPVTAWAGAHAGADRMTNAEIILRGDTYLHPDKKTDGSPSHGKLVTMPPQEALESEFRRVVGDAFAGKPQAASGALQATQAAYAALIGDTPGDVDPKNVNKTVFDRALKVALGEVYDYNGRKVVLPYGMSGDQFKEGTKRLIDQLYAQRASSIDTPKDKLLDLPLRNAGDGRYTIWAGDGNVVYKDRKDARGRPIPIEIDMTRGLPYIPSGAR